MDEQEDPLSRYSDIDFDRDFHQVADSVDYEAQGNAIKTILNSPDSQDIVGSMELGYFLEKAKKLNKFSAETAMIEKYLALHPEDDLRSAEDVMNNLLYLADHELHQGR